MNNIGKNLRQVVINIVIQFPLNLAQKIPVNGKLVGIHQQLFAHASHQPFQRVLEVKLSAELLLDE